MKNKEIAVALSKLPIAASVLEIGEEIIIAEANQFFYDFLGYSKQELESKSGNYLSVFLQVEKYLHIHSFLSNHEGTLSLELELKGLSKSIWAHAIITKFTQDRKIVTMMYLFNIEDYKKHSNQLDNLIDLFEQVLDTEKLGMIMFEADTGMIQHCYTKSFVIPGHCVHKVFPDIFIKTGRVHKDSIKKLEKVVASMKTAEENAQRMCELLVLNIQNEYIWLRFNFTKKEYNNTTYILGVLSDINTEKYAAMKYHEQSLFYQSMLSSKDAYGHMDIDDDKILMVGGLWNGYNELKEKMSYTEIIHTFIEKVAHPDDIHKYLELMERERLIDSYQNGTNHLECELQRIINQNKMSWMCVSVHLFKNPINQHLMGLVYMKNINQEKEIRNQEFSDIELDYLTHLYNKKTLKTQIHNAVENLHKKEIGVFIVCDINAFRKFNIIYGYSLGDEILKQVADSLVTIFDHKDIIGRYEGDKFFVFSKNHEKNELKSKIAKLFAMISKNREQLFTLSIGIVHVKKGDIFMNYYKQARMVIQSFETKTQNQYDYFQAEFMDEKLAHFIENEDEMIEEDYSNSSIDSLLSAQGDIAYLVNPQNYMLLVGNKAFYDRLGIKKEDCYGKCCYELLHKRESPCSFCQKSRWSFDKFYMYRNYNEVLDQEFLIKNKCVTWKGETALLAIAVDLSNDKRNTDTFENDITEESYLLAGIRNMQKVTSIAEVMESALETIGHFFRADTVRFWNGEKQNETLVCTNTYFHPDLNKNLYQYDEIEIEIISNWLKNRKWSSALAIENQELMMFESYDMYQIMYSKQIENEHWVLLNDDNSPLGFIEMENKRANLQNMSFLKNFLPFIVNEWKKCKMVENIIFNIRNDGLTGLLNRTSYDDFCLTYSPDQLENIAIVVIDILGLADINSIKGSGTGDLYLRELSTMIKKCFPTGECYRLGGDEFQIVVKNTNVSSLEKAIQNLRNEVDNYQAFTISIGYAWDSIEKNLLSLSGFAKNSMELDKKNQSVKIQSIKESDYYKQQSDLISHIEKGDYLIYLQPKVNARTGSIVGAEALIRYYEEKRGIIPPSEYIPKYEKNGLIRHIDLFVFEEVCKLISKWLQKQKKCPVISLNFSRFTMMEQNLISIMNNVVEKYDIPKKYVEIEITESYAEVGKTLLYQSAKRIHDNGFSVSLDDFGTEFTNLSILSDIHVDVLKIDKSLIHSMAHQKKNLTVLKYIVDMCNELNIQVIAEGVENMEQRDLLLKMNCEIIQGYWFSRPVDVISFEKAFLPRVK